MCPEGKNRHEVFTLKAATVVITPVWTDQSESDWLIGETLIVFSGNRP